jgi:hypothetical protein
MGTYGPIRHIINLTIQSHQRYNRPSREYFPPDPTWLHLIIALNSIYDQRVHTASTQPQPYIVIPDSASDAPHHNDQDYGSHNGYLIHSYNSNS